MKTILDYTNIKVVAIFFGVSRQAVLKKIKTGKLLALKVGNNWFIDRKEIKKLRFGTGNNPVGKNTNGITRNSKIGKIG